MSYVFESKRDLVYHQNYLALKQAIENAGASGWGADKLLRETASELLTILANNKIKLNPVYNGNED